MNFLAHVYLARHSPLAMIGALLGDFNPGPDIARLPTEIVREIQIHRLVDSFTDQHPQVLACKSLFPDGIRRFSGIVLDLYFDYLLSVHWQRYTPISRRQLIDDCYQALHEHHHLLPASLQNIRPRMIDQDWLASYGEPEGLKLAANRTAQRISRHGERLMQAYHLSLLQHVRLEQAFLNFFPELENYTAQQRKLLSMSV